MSALKYQTDCLRYLDKGVNANERDNYATWIKEQIDIYGQNVNYFVQTYSLTAHDAVYGEQPTVTYRNPVSLVMFVELNEQSTMLSKFGLQGDDDVTAYIPITKFQDSITGYEGHPPEPKSGDVFTLHEYGNDRPNGRAGKSFEITQRLDQEVSTVNPLMGHYVWYIKAKRLDYSFEQGLSGEAKSSQVYDNNFSGTLSGFTSPQTEAKAYADDVDVQAKTVFDYKNINDLDDVYGDYN